MRHFLAGCLGLVVLALTGCGSPGKATVSGTVTFDGEPLPDGQIAFIPEGAGQGGGGTITAGKYSVTAQTGKNRVEITASKMLPLPPGQVGMDGAKEELRQFIPARYNAKSELTADIPSSTPLDFPLKR